METSVVLKKIGLILLGVTIILVAVLVIPLYIPHDILPIIEVIIVFSVLLLAYFVVWKAI